MSRYVNVFPTNSWHRNVCGMHPTKTSHWDYDYMHSWDSALSENLKVTDVSRFFLGGGTGKWCQSFFYIQLSKRNNTPLKIKMEHNHVEVWLRSFSRLFMGNFRFQPFIFQGVLVGTQISEACF